MAPSKFALPTGVLGTASGAVMARLNADMERCVAEAALARSPGEVLAIGFGPGVGVARLLDTPEVTVSGVDPSAVMVRAAQARNREAVHDGRADLRIGTAEELPWVDATFDAVVSVNNIQLWNPLDGGLAEVRRVLRAGGVLVVGVHAWAWKRGPDTLAGALNTAGLAVIDGWEASARSGDALYAVASK